MWDCLPLLVNGGHWESILLVGPFHADRFVRNFVHLIDKENINLIDQSTATSFSVKLAIGCAAAFSYRIPGIGIVLKIAND